MLALVDADGLIFSCGFAVEHTAWFVYREGDGEIPSKVFYSKRDLNNFIKENPLFGSAESYPHKEVEPLENCLYLVKRKMESILENTKATSYKVFIKGTGNFREEVAVTRKYKGNRDATHRPVYEQDIRQYLLKQYSAIIVDGMEVDDAVAIEQFENISYLREIDADGNQVITCGSIICSPDKDLNQIPGWHYDYNKQMAYWVSEADALRALYVQILAGDASDNVQGIPGVGPKTAERLLEKANSREEMHGIALSEYTKAYGDSGYNKLLEMATLVYIKRTEDDKWTPPK